jgi:ubiquinol-cytochrome c reductase cytochrome c subunit
VNDEFDEVEGFEPAVPASGSAADRRAASGRATAVASRSGAGDPPAARSRGGVRRKLGAGVVLLAALGVMGVSYATFADTSGATTAAASPGDIDAGRQIYANSCISCHGANLEGVKNQGPSLIGVGGASVYFQVYTGRMPAVGQGSYEPRKEPKYSERQVEQIASYVESVGGGPQLPSGNLIASPAGLGSGGELYRLNCASCHGATMKGAPLAAGAYAPSLNKATNKVIWAAMLSGPENMPVFGDNEVTPQQKSEIIAYIQTMKASADPGGNGIDRIGPVSEAIVIWVGGVGAIVIAILWIGAKVR